MNRFSQTILIFIQTIQTKLTIKEMLEEKEVSNVSLNND
jgi:hypothetical protein